MTTIDIVKCSTGEVVATIHGTSEAAWEAAWGWYGMSHLCPDVDPKAPRFDFREFEPIERRAQLRDAYKTATELSTYQRTGRRET